MAEISIPDIHGSAMARSVLARRNCACVEALPGNRATAL
jgi:hypothetical protein